MPWNAAFDRAGQANSVWPALLLLFVAVLAPTACVLWFMQQAVESQELADRQKLRDAYRGQLSVVSRQFSATWRDWAVRVTRSAAAATAEQASAHPARQFAAMVASGEVDSAIVVDVAGRLLYPDAAAPGTPAPEESRTAWLAAQHLETGARDLLAAAAAYGKIALQATEPVEQARAVQAQIRCLVRGGQTAELAPLVFEAFRGTRLAAATDAAGRLIAPDAELLSLELLGASQHPLSAEIEARLRGRLNDYGSPMAAPQRRFLMSALRALRPDAAPFATEAAEAHAARFAEIRTAADRQPGLRSTGIEGLWQYRIPSGDFVLLATEDRVQAIFHEVAREAVLPANSKVILANPDNRRADEEADLATAAGGEFPGWSIALAVSGDQPLLAATRQRIVWLWWTGLLSIGTIVALATLVALAMRRQFALARLKNDLVATVSHELKTPLASMRLLVETLLDSERLDEVTTREYLRLAAAENERLSRLIENFLSFSRMERGGPRFSRRPTTVGQLVAAVETAAGERFATERCRLGVRLEAPDARLVVDFDAVVTALLNLLDNAYKFSGELKRIELTTFLRGDEACFAVEDNGIGLPPRSARKVFDRFYQVDQSLARSNSGCGLGLAIVQNIVHGHGGQIDVCSRPGHGSTFTIRFPLANEPVARIGDADAT